MWWSRVERMNEVCECSPFMMEAQNYHRKALRHIMEYICGTKERGLFLKPSKWWDGKMCTNECFQFEVNGKSNNKHAKDES